MRDRLRNFAHSIFFKLLLAVLATGICINIAVGGFFMYLSAEAMRNAPLRKNIARYAAYLARDIDSPEKAREIAAGLSIDIGFEGPAGRWSTGEPMPAVRDMEIKEYFQGSPVQLGRHERKRYIILQEGESRYIFNFMNSYLRQNFAEVRVLVLILLLSAILVCAYFVIRWILGPVTRLNEGVAQVGAGNLEYRVPPGGRDELGRLAAAFNAMTGRIKAMLASREQLLLDVSHELRSPVTRIKVALEFIPETDAKKSVREDLSEMEAMITELLEAHRLDSEHGRLELQEADLAALVRQVVAGFSHREPGVAVSPAAGPLPVRIDPRRIKIVLDNILENALKYSQGAGQSVRVYFEQTQSYSVVKIQDAGQGIPQEDLPHIFEPFYRVDRSRSKQTGGYGLGLSICKTIMEAHGGKIGAESGPDSGTTISLFFSRGEAK